MIKFYFKIILVFLFTLFLSDYTFTRENYRDFTGQSESTPQAPSIIKQIKPNIHQADKNYGRYYERITFEFSTEKMSKEDYAVEVKENEIFFRFFKTQMNPLTPKILPKDFRFADSIRYTFESKSGNTNQGTALYTIHLGNDCDVQCRSLDDPGRVYIDLIDPVVGMNSALGPVILKAGESDSLSVFLKIEEGWVINYSSSKLEWQPTTLTLDVPGTSAFTITNTLFPGPNTPRHLKFQGISAAAYTDRIKISIPIAITESAQPGSYRLSGQVSYQAYKPANRQEKKADQLLLVRKQNIHIPFEIQELEPIEFKEYGIRALQESRWNDALSLLSRGAALMSDDHDLWFELARAYYYNTKLDSAKIILEKLLETRKTDANIYYWLGRTCVLNKQYTEAVEMLTRALPIISKTDPEILFFLAMSYAQLGQTDQAVTHFTQVLEHNNIPINMSEFARSYIKNNASNSARPEREAPDATVAPPVDVTDIKLMRLGGDTIKFSSYKNKVILLHFWAAWCAPCREEIPSLNVFYDGVYKDYESQGLVLLTVSLDFEPRDAEVFRDRYDLKFPILFDPDNRLTGRITRGEIPKTAIVDRSGVVREILPSQNWENVKVHRKIEKYLR